MRKTTNIPAIFTKNSTPLHLPLTFFPQIFSVLSLYKTENENEQGTWTVLEFRQESNRSAYQRLPPDRNRCIYTKYVRISESVFCSTTTLLPTVITATLKFSNYASSNVKCGYFHPHATLSGAVDLNKCLPIHFSLTLGTPIFALGVGYKSRSGLENYSGGITALNHVSCASAIVGDNGDTIKASYIHCFDQSTKFVVAGEISRKFSTNENMFTVGGPYAIDSLNLVKMKVNNHGMLGAVLQQEANGKSHVAISSEVDIKALNKAPRLLSRNF